MLTLFWPYFKHLSCRDPKWMFILHSCKKCYLRLFVSCLHKHLALCVYHCATFLIVTLIKGPSLNVLGKSYYTSGINCVNCSDKPWKLFGVWNFYLFIFFFIEAFGTTSKFCNVDCFPQNSKHIFGNKATALKRWWDPLCNEKILISIILFLLLLLFFFFFFFFLLGLILGMVWGLEKLGVLFSLLPWIQK